MAKKVLLGVAVALTMSAAAVVHAESAPVYDADTMQHDDYSLDQGQDLPMPPPPGQDTGAYVPPQPPPTKAPTVAVAQDNTAGIEKRLKQIEQQVNNLQTDSSAARVESLQKEVQSLRGQVEQLTHQAQQMQNQQKSMYSDLDKRLALADAQPAKKSADPVTDDTDAGLDIKASQKAALVKKPAKPVTAPDSGAGDTAANDLDQPNASEEQKIYQTAYNQIKAKKYDDAVKTLQGMLKKYPSGQFASNAHYWLGELYGLMGKHNDALKEFNVVASDYPQSPRVADAQLKIGLIYAAQFNWADAKSTFKKIINRYPGTASARLASDQLRQIKDAGH